MEMMMMMMMMMMIMIDMVICNTAITTTHNKNTKRNNNSIPKADILCCFVCFFGLYNAKVFLSFKRNHWRR
jgi:hypothetical protein